LFFAVTVYCMMHLREGLEHCIIYMTFLVQLVVISTMVNLIMGMCTRNIMSGILIGVIVIMHFIMFTSLFMNAGKDVVPPSRCFLTPPTLNPHGVAVKAT
jgi:hypothetical protein